MFPIMARHNSFPYLVISIIYLTDSLQVTPQTYSFPKLISQLYGSDNLCGDCSLQLVWHHSILNISSSQTNRNLDFLSKVLPETHNKLRSNGVTVTTYGPGAVHPKNFKTYKQPAIITHSRRCSVVIIFVQNFTVSEEVMLKNTVNAPILQPPTVRNRDKYLIVTGENRLLDLHNSKFVKGLKYKLFLVPSSVQNGACKFISNITTNNCSAGMEVTVLKSCQYGLCKRKRNASYFSEVNLNKMLLDENFEMEHLFPDYEKNFYGYTLRLSTTTKVPQLLEMDVVKDENLKNIYLPRRGLYAMVLKELTRRLNFTYIIVPSSGKGSTGHALPNGTWVGTVGDTYRGEVDFGFMAAITYQRFPYAEFCAPINFAYLGFVTGPPRKTYRWDAIIWPFDHFVWILLGVIILFASKILSVFSRYSVLISEMKWFSDSSSDQIQLLSKLSAHPRTQQSISWTYFKSMASLVGGLFEQCETLPRDLSISFKVFLIIWLMFCLVISAAYRSKMVSLLTFPIYDHVPDTFDELATARDFPIDFHYFGNVGYSYFKSSTNPAFMKIFERMGKEPDPIKCVQRTLLEKAACIIFIATYEEILHRNLSDIYGNSPLKFTPHRGALFPAGVIHEYKAPLSNNFKRVLYPAMETGMIPNWQKEDFAEILEKKNKWQHSNNININSLVWGSEFGVAENLLRVKHLHGAFLFFGVGLIISLLAFFAENRKRYTPSKVTVVVFRKFC